MVGIEIFTQHFKDFHESYIVIGGIACEDHFDEEGLDFRATKDIDLVLVVEAVNNDFIAKFWEFIEFANLMHDTSPDIKSIMKIMGVISVTADDLVNQIVKVFRLEN